MAFNQNSMLLIAGPCQIEGASHCMDMAEALAEIASGLPVDFVFKASYDKANRTSYNSPRGVGLEIGVEILREIGEQIGCQTTTDVHDVDEVRRAGPVVDVIQIPALLCRQTDLLVAAGNHARRAVNIKKGQFMSPWQMFTAAEKVVAGCYVCEAGHVPETWITERGTFFGYGDLVVDMRSLVYLRKAGDKIIFDASHSAQYPASNANKSSGGDRKVIEPLARAALAAGVDGLFIEVHDDPFNAKSDGDIAWPLDGFRDLIERLLRVWEVAKPYRDSYAQELDPVAGKIYG